MHHNKHVEVRGQLCELVLSFYLYIGPRGSPQIVRLVLQAPLPPKQSCHPKAWELNPNLFNSKACTVNHCAKTLPN